MMNPVVASILLVLVASCAVQNGEQVTPAEVPEDFHVEMETTACYGTCPVYTVSISADGTVRFRGDRFVAAEGEHVAQASPTEVEEVFAALQEARFFSLNASYGWDNPVCGPEIADLPTVIIRARVDDVKHEVRRDEACEYRPEGWRPLVQALEGLPQVEEWVGVARL